MLLFCPSIFSYQFFIFIFSKPKSPKSDKQWAANFSILLKPWQLLHLSVKWTIPYNPTSPIRNFRKVMFSIVSRLPVQVVGHHMTTHGPVHTFSLRDTPWLPPTCSQVFTRPKTLLVLSIWLQVCERISATCKNQNGHEHLGITDIKKGSQQQICELAKLCLYLLHIPQYCDLLVEVICLISSERVPDKDVENTLADIGNILSKGIVTL